VYRRSLALLLSLTLLLAGWTVVTAETGQHKAYLVEINGPIGPATADYFTRSLDKAEAQGAALLIIRMDTPGGLDTAMRDMVKRIIAAQIPVITYVAPGGARAASAGTYILYASHLAVMAPATNLGAATPVSLGSLPKQPQGDAPDEQQDQSPDQREREKAPMPTDAKERKVVNDAAAYMRSLAKLRGRNAAWGEEAVRDGASLSAAEALELGVIDFIAADLDGLLQQLHGRQVQLPLGLQTLTSDDLAIEVIEPDWQSQLLSIVSNPNLAYILMLVGIYGLIYEFANPGSIVPGTAGAICLLLALYAFQVLPVNYAGMALILLGLALMVGEAFVPSIGALGIGGVIAFVIGSLVLIDTEQPGYGISLSLIVSLGVGSAFLLFFIAGMAMKSHRRPVVSGREEMLTSQGVVVDDFAREGEIRVHGEIWSARSQQPLRKNQAVRVTGRRGLILDVTPMDTKEK
jgi:membrane-bound serine protease (ClpP class)